MKKALNKVFKKGNIESVLVGLGVLLIIEYLIFPGLTAPDTFTNIVSSLGAIVLGLFVYYYIVPEKPIEELKPGETELDYIPEEEVVKKKSTKKKTTKSEFPLPPHHRKKSEPLKPKKK